MTTYNVLSLFAGIGGIDLGLERTGRFTTAAYSEIDPYACRVMSEQFPEAVPLGDVTTIQFLRYQCGTCTAYSPTTKPLAASDQDGEVNLGTNTELVIAGGFPCQDISHAGKGAGITAGTRSGLWSYIAHAVRVLRPGGLIVENVDALLVRGLDTVLGDLARSGYDAQWGVLRADRQGFPHARRRLFLIAYPTRADADAGGERAQVPPRRSDATVQKPRRPSSPRSTQREPRFAWTARPQVGRGGDGLPDWVDGDTVIEPADDEHRHRWDRLRCLGNAVVPQVAEYVGHILAHHLDRSTPDD